MNMNEVKEFVNINVVRASQHVLHWQKTGLQPDDSIVCEIAHMLVQLEIPYNVSLSLAENLIKTAAMEFVVESTKDN